MADISDIADPVVDAIYKRENAFMRNIERIPFSGCWIWMGTSNDAGYGQIIISGKRFYTHRVSHIMFKGIIPDGMMVCHHCDTPACVNPYHLFIGTAKDNINDMINKGRQVIADQSGSKNGMYGIAHSEISRTRQSIAKQGRYLGSNHPRSTINETIATAIRQSKGTMTAKQAAEKFNASWNVVRNIWSNKSWRNSNG